MPRRGGRGHRTEPSSADASGAVKALEKALLILDALKRARSPLGVSELARVTEVKAATAHRLLQTMISTGWVVRDPNDQYSVGPKITFVTEKTNFYVALKEVSSFVMRPLSARMSQAMNLTVREHAKCFILQQSRTERMVDFVPPVGFELPIHASASGKILLSELSAYLLDEILRATELRAFTPHTITSSERLLVELDAARALGYAVDRSESVESGSCIAVPVRSPDGEIIAALSFSGFIGGLDEDRLPDYREPLRQAAQEISSGVFRAEAPASVPHRAPRPAPPRRSAR